MRQKIIGDTNREPWKTLEEKLGREILGKLGHSKATMYTGKSGNHCVCPGQLSCSEKTKGNLAFSWAGLKAPCKLEVKDKVELGAA